MKTLILTSLVTLQVILSSSARADEDSWQAVSFTTPELQSDIVGFKTDDGTFRLTEVKSATTDLKISGGLFKADPKKAEVRCKGYGNNLRIAKTVLNNVYTFKTFIYPLAASELKQLKTNIQNAPAISAIEVHLAPVSADPIVTPAARQQFEDNLSKEIWNQIDSIKDNGELTVQLAQVDDVACDLILNQSQLEIRFGLTIELAKHIRQPIISADDFGRVYENVRSKSVLTKNPSQLQILNGANLNAAMMKELGKSLEDFQEKNFLRISQGIFNSETGDLIIYSKSQYFQAARAMDVLKIYTTMIPSSVKAKASAAEEL